MEDHEVIIAPVILCVLILSQSARSPSFDISFHGSSSIPIASFVERLFIKTYCHRRYLNRRIVYSSGHHGTFNPAVITGKGMQILEGVTRHKPSALADSTHLDLHNSSYHTQPSPKIANYTTLSSRQLKQNRWLFGLFVVINPLTPVPPVTARDEPWPLFCF